MVDLEPDQQIDLVGWLGGGDYVTDEWERALLDAREME
jgi:hypothetical protein